MLSIISIDFVKSFGQRGVNNQLVTAPVLRRRLSLSSLIFAFHYISQHLETQQHQHRPSTFSPHHQSLAYTSPLLEVNTPRQVMERITCSPIILLKHSASAQIRHFYSVPELLEQQSTFIRLTWTKVLSLAAATLWKICCLFSVRRPVWKMDPSACNQRRDIDPWLERRNTQRIKVK